MTQPQKAPISTNEVRSTDSTIKAGIARVDMKFEIVVLPVSDVDRAKEFYERLRWRQSSSAKTLSRQRPAPHKACI